MEEIPVPDPVVSRSSDVLAVRISFMEEQIDTKAISSTDENRIDSLRIFVFTDAGSPGKDPADVFAYMLAVHKDSIKKDTPPLRATVLIKELPEQRFVLVANMPYALVAGLNLQEGVTTEEQLIKQLKFSAAAWRTALTSGNFTPFPMWGETVFYNSSNPLPTLPGHIDVSMTRALAGIEVGVDINNPAAKDPAVGFGTIFKIDSVYVCNVNDSVYIASAGAIKTKKVDIGYAFPATELALKRSIYVPETESLIIEAGDTMHQPPYIVLKARYYDGAPYYYRVDFTRDNAYIPLLRNHKYTVNITGIRTVGHQTLSAAKNAPILPLNPNLILGNDAATASINHVVYTGTYWLGCEATDVKVDWNDPNASIQVGTSYPGGWKAELENSFTGVSIFPSSVLSSTNTLEVRYSDQNLTGSPRTVKIKLTAGTLTQYINVTQSPGSHTYVTQVGTSASIPLASANIDGVNRASGITWVKYYYDETPPTTPASDNISGNIATIPISFINRAGKIIVTAFNNANDTVWAWSVWVVPAGVDFSTSANQRYYNGYTFMDRNLLDGASYQWGRKDPAIDTTHVFVPPAVDLQQVVKSPRAFYLSGTSPYDWLNVQHNNLWTTTEGEKGLYDPCPFGWRVPPAENDAASPWNGFTNGNNNMTLPTGGGINGTTGQPIESTARLVWGASARGADAYLYNAGTGSHTKAHRTNAYPIRCVRDVKRSGGSLIIEN
jgi:hypothetical protein